MISKKQDTLNYKWRPLKSERHLIFESSKIISLLLNQQPADSLYKYILSVMN